jgi:hypothetical protein
MRAPFLNNSRTDTQPLSLSSMAGHAIHVHRPGKNLILCRLISRTGVCVDVPYYDNVRY